jgi:hypothetical protein
MERSLLDGDQRRFRAVELSIQKDGDAYVVGRVGANDFYQIPEIGARILRLLGSGDTKAGVASRLGGEPDDQVDVASFVDALHGLGLAYPEGDGPRATGATPRSRRTVTIGPGVARALTSGPVMVCGLALVVFALIRMAVDPRLRVDLNAFYFDSNRTALFLLVTAFSLLLAAVHEFGHVVAAARHGVASGLGIGTRMWTIVAEADITGVLSLPKARRYIPMLAGMIVDILCIAVLTVILDILLHRDAGGFAIQFVRALILSNVLGLVWQTNIFMKTDLYYLICTVFNHPDLDADARRFLGDLSHRLTRGRFGRRAEADRRVARSAVIVFSAIWLLGRALAITTLLSVGLPTLWRYTASVVTMWNQPTTAPWDVYDTAIYVCLTMTLLAAGMYMWLKQR